MAEDLQTPTMPKWSSGGCASGWGRVASVLQAKCEKLVQCPQRRAAGEEPTALVIGPATQVPDAFKAAWNLQTKLAGVAHASPAGVSHPDGVAIRTAPDLGPTTSVAFTQRRSDLSAPSPGASRSGRTAANSIVSIGAAETGFGIG